MELQDLLVEAITRGIAEATRAYAHRELFQKGAVDGFTACRGKEPVELALLLGDARERCQQAYRAKAPDYWYHRLFEAQVEWVCNVASVALHYEGKPTIVVPTGRAVRLVGDIYRGVKS